MDHVWTLPKLARLALALFGSLVFVSAARGAVFTLTPAESPFSSGAGPFYWSMKSSSAPDSETGWVGYKLSTESTWHRCLGPTATVSLNGLADRTYMVEIADDVNEDNLAARGLFNSGLNTCPYPTIAPPGAITQSATITIDSTPPLVAAPQVVVSGDVAQVSVTAGDSGTGIASYTWDFGDGAEDATTAPYDVHTYLLPGTYSGQVVVADGAGNRAAQPFTVVVAPTVATTPGGGAATPPVKGTTTGAPAPLPSLTVGDARRYAADVVRLHTGLVRPRIRAACSAINAQTAHCKLAWTAAGYANVASGKVWLFDRPDGFVDWAYAFRGTRTRVSCRKKHPSSASCVRSFGWT
jgi:PKD domain